jgi:hypothetical protein
MKKNILLLSSILFVSCFNSKNPETENSLPDETTYEIYSSDDYDSSKFEFSFHEKIDTFFIAENDSSFFRIGIHENVIRNIFKNYQDTTFAVVDVGIYGEGDGTLILKDTTPYFFFYPDDESKRIKCFIFYHDKFHTNTGIHPGMTVGQIKKIYPDCKVGISIEDDTEYIYIPEEKIYCELEYIPGIRAGDYNELTDDENGETSKINLKAKVFSVFKLGKL